MAYTQQVVAVEIVGDFKTYRIIGFHDNTVSIATPPMSSRPAGTLTVQVTLEDGQDLDDAARIAVLTDRCGSFVNTTATVQSAAALERCKPDRMQEVLIKTLHFLCRAALEGVGPVSGLSVLCNTKSSKEQVFRALKVLSSQNPNLQMPYEAPVSRFSCPVNKATPVTPADELYEVKDLLWALDRLHMLYKLAQAAAV